MKSTNSDGERHPFVCRRRLFSLDSLSLVRSVIFQSSTPASLINDGCLRKFDKSILTQKLGSIISSSFDPDILIIYGNQFLKTRGLASVWYCCRHRGNLHGPSRHAGTHIFSYFLSV